ncbi:lantibiotic immunity ABC transporter MutE/EpiE family permease subunit [Clostridium botulinum D/C]|uniref:lantibiotic immunity ABC transporter MutE/EpiE family permease subunit n=2 Tax=Clostridium botulinum TaxID=1491 RepID=UPI001E2EA36B|nr:lantibiotic immunity ABC transporter MutE/EpiE family permease subunit [Clostridium botulinum]MCD3351855.1 lantibiotic immunity ABC transporter MutE/EpiE family permease subunit [Clostridium botulinum D/C]MCD3359070.1 lantibiotic immunity ABC transporter MutE/EpiE family permease subunit [Clostridium botulinum D/C]MCD3364657.1 lantibiotic immunity ABC transporter MutE/EpiE family permease subunit [Clostridium botulinum D/C]
MINMLRSEHLKYKRTFSRKLFFIVPMYVLLNLITMTMYFFINTLNFWSCFIIPSMISLICALSALREKRAGNYRTLKSKDINLKKMWISKILIITYYEFLTSIVFLIIMLLVKLIYKTSLIHPKELLIATFVIFITTLILIPICLFLAEIFGTFAPILMTLIGVMVGVIFATKSIWYLCPFSIAPRLMCPIIKVHPSGIPLEIGSPLLDPSVISKGFIISIALFIILSIITSFWFSKRRN